jgi:outer membrane protein W
MAIMQRWTLMVLLACFSMPLSAQTAVTVWLSSQQNGGGDAFPASRPDATIEFAAGSGFGVSVNRMFGRKLSGELSLFRLTSDAALEAAGVDFVSLGEVELTPLMAMLQYHFRPDAPLDVYVGAGAAYVVIADLDSADLRADGLAPLELDEEVTAVFGGGVTWSFSQRWGASLDARYLPLTLHAHGVGEMAQAGMDPLLVSAGLRLRF